MNTTRLLVLAALACAPVLSFAGSTPGLTRAEVRADLVRVEQAGYRPAGYDAQYPLDLQAALVRVRSDQNSPSLSQFDADDERAPKPAAHRRATVRSQAARDEVPGFGAVYVHS
ncbi:DUF4148 domain-containing protein [Burkholderia gladioli]|uniref:DUF4148 domain-containing protein n=1 Tax=Burkholderia gladioli TaxID=28095 RepID=UPI00163E9C39|nr:DUF4148 domain-containing protein [Burkholderia gladioli]